MDNVLCMLFGHKWEHVGYGVIKTVFGNAKFKKCRCKRCKKSKFVK